MKVEKYTPSEALKPFIKTFMIIESEDGMKNKILPDTSMVMAFRLKGSVTKTEGDAETNLPLSVITGLKKSLSIMSYSRNTGNLIVKFTEGGAAAFFREPLHEFFGLTVSLDDLLGKRKISEIEEKLAEAKSNILRITIIERFLLSELKETKVDFLIREAMQKITHARGNTRIHELLRDLSISRDPFEKRFRKVIGTSPKQFSAIVRLRNLIDHHANTVNLTDAAYSAGYFDQPHFIKDFRLFTGQAPKDFFKSSGWW